MKYVYGGNAHEGLNNVNENIQQWDRSVNQSRLQEHSLRIYSS